jgi:hypothetical protein
MSMRLGDLCPLVTQQLGAEQPPAGAVSGDA